jgi:hypothetical protein
MLGSNPRAGAYIDAMRETHSLPSELVSLLQVAIGLSSGTSVFHRIVCRSK